MPQEVTQLFSSADAEQQLDQHYRRMLAELPFPVHELTVQTPSFGQAHVTVAGKEDGPPLMLWQGAYTPGPYMLEMCKQLVQHYRVFAPDTPCHGGKSTAVELDPGNHELGRWCVEVMAGLGLLREGQPPLLHVGVSYGGCTITDLACVAPETIRAAALVVPGCIHPEYGSWRHRMRLGLQCTLPMMLYRLLPNRWTGWLTLWRLMDEPSSQDLITQHLLMMFRFMAYWGPGPGVFSAEQLAGLKAPVLLIAAEDDIFGPGAVTAARARQVFPDCTAEVVPRAKHCFNEERMAQACQRIIDFFRQRFNA